MARKWECLSLFTSIDDPVPPMAVQSLIISTGGGGNWQLVCEYRGSHPVDNALEDSHPLATVIVLETSSGLRPKPISI